MMKIPNNTEDVRTALDHVMSHVQNEPEIIRTYLVEVAGTSSLQEFFVSTHSDAECVNGLIPMMPCCSKDVTVLSVECLDLRLKEATNPGEDRISEQRGRVFLVIITIIITGPY